MFDKNPIKAPGLWLTVELALSAVERDRLNEEREETRLMLEAIETLTRSLAETLNGGPLQDRADKIAELATATRQQFTGRYPIINRIWPVPKILQHKMGHDKTSAIQQRKKMPCSNFGSSDIAASRASVSS